MFTSLQDSFGNGCPRGNGGRAPRRRLWNHQGVGTMISEQAAIKVPVTSPASTVQGLADAIRALAASPELGQRLSEVAAYMLPAKAVAVGRRA